MYYLPFSSHSNFHELEMFVASVRPAVLRCVVNFTKNSLVNVRNIKEWHNYTYVLRTMQQRGVPLLRDLYVRFETRSEDYKFACDPQNRESFMEALGLDGQDAKADDVRGYSTKTFAQQNFADRVIEHPEMMEEFRPKVPVPKPKGKDQKIDRMIKKANNQKQKAIKGKPSNPDKLVQKLHGQDFKLEDKAEESRDYIPTLGKSIEVFTKLTEENQRRSESELGDSDGHHLGYLAKSLGELEDSRGGLSLSQEGESDYESVDFEEDGECGSPDKYSDQQTTAHKQDGGQLSSEHKNHDDTGEDFYLGAVFGASLSKPTDNQPN